MIKYNAKEGTNRRRHRAAATYLREQLAVERAKMTELAQRYCTLLTTVSDRLTWVEERLRSSFVGTDVAAIDQAMAPTLVRTNEPIAEAAVECIRRLRQEMVRGGNSHHGHDDSCMTDDQEAHLRSVLDDFCSETDAKYRKGQREHGGNLSDALPSTLVTAAMEEAVDLYVYLHTLRAKVHPVTPVTSDGGSGGAVNTAATSNAGAAGGAAARGGGVGLCDCVRTERSDVLPPRRHWVKASERLSASQVCFVCNGTGLES